MSERKSQSVLNGALILTASTIIVKIIGMLFKIPLAAMIGTVGRGYFNTAYDIYTPIYAISIAGLPVAVAKLVSQNVARNRIKDAQLIFKVSKKVFLVTGLTGFMVLAILAYPYAHFIANDPDVIWAILIIAPSILFCCLMSSYKGYYEGLRNMTPSGVTQIIEASVKLIIGLGVAKYIVNLAFIKYENTGLVFGKQVIIEEGQTLRDAIVNTVAPYAAAGAVLSVTIGSIVGLLFLIVHNKIKGDNFTREELINSLPPKTEKETLKELILFALPIALSSLTLNLTNLIDAPSIRYCLNRAVSNNIELIRNIYPSLAGTANDKVSTFLYGAYSMSADFRSLVPMIAVNFGVSAIPAISALWALKDKNNDNSKKEINSTINSIFRVISMIAIPAGIGMAVFAEPILSLLYSGTQSEVAIPICVPIMRVFGLLTLFMSISTPITNILQAIGRTDIPVKSLLIGSVAKIVINFLLVRIPSININGAVIGTTVYYLITLFINLIVLIKETKVKFELKSVLFKPLLSSVISIFVSYGGYWLLENKIFAGHGRINTLIAIIFAVILYIFATLLLKGINKDDVLMLPKGEKIAKTLEKHGLLG